MKNIDSKICFPCVQFNHSSLYLMCIVAYLRQCVENKGSVSAWLCCLAAFLSFSLFLFFLQRLFFPSPHLFVRTRMSHHRQAPQRGTGKKISLCSQQAELVIDGRLNKNRRGALSAKLWKTETTFMVKKKVCLYWLSFSDVFKCDFSALKSSHS